MLHILRRVTGGHSRPRILNRQAALAGISFRRNFHHSRPLSADGPETEQAAINVPNYNQKSNTPPIKTRIAVGETILGSVKNLNRQQGEVLTKFPLGSDVYKATRCGSNAATRLPELGYSYVALSKTPGMLFVDKTKYIELLEANERYRYLFLRPPRFGKSTFLRMLCSYYDIAQAATFEDAFGGLFICSNPTPSRSRHLVLLLDLSMIDVNGNAAATETNFHTWINYVLRNFLEKYWGWIGDDKSDIQDMICSENASISLMEVLKKVKKAGYTLFVGIDDYDALANDAAFEHNRLGSGPDRLNKVAAIELFLNERLFAILKAACGDGPYGCISKYFLTGVLPALWADMVPLTTAVKLISNEPQFHGICGLTDQQVRIFAEAYLDPGKDVSLDDFCRAVRGYYSGYYFASSAHELDRLYNPWQIFHYLYELKSCGSVIEPEESLPVHTTHILKSVAGPGNFSVIKFVELVATGSRKTKILHEFGFADLMTLRKMDSRVMLSSLVYLGDLTRDIRPGVVRIPNEIMKNKILERIHEYFNAVRW